MKRIIIFFAFVITLAACDKVPINGDLDGMWQLTCIETKHDTTYQKNLFWQFQLHLLQIGDVYDYFARFENTGSELRVYQVASGSRHEDASQNDEPVTEKDSVHMAKLKQYGIYKTDTRFKIEELNADNMRLRSDSVCLHFRKY